MSLLMDALRKAEADKKQASAAKPDAVTREFQQKDDIDLAATIATKVKYGAAGITTQPAIESEVQSAASGTLALEPLELELDPITNVDEVESLTLGATAPAGSDPKGIASRGDHP